MYKLVIEDDEGKTTVVPIVRDEITIGRKEGNTIRLTERNVSRRHARIIKEGEGVRVENVASRYGIKHNGEKIKESAPFKEGDVVMIGDYRLSLQAERKAKPPAAPKAGVQVPASAEKSDKAAAVASSEELSVDKAGRLVVVSSNYAGREYPLVKAEMVIGRTEGDIRIDHRSISRNHAKIVRDGDRYKIIDLRSSNGVRVNGEEYRSVHLKNGDQIELGHVKFRFVPAGVVFHITPDIAAPVDIGPTPGGGSGGLGKIFVGVLGAGGLLIVLLLIGFVVVNQMGDKGNEKKNPAVGEKAEKGDDDDEKDEPESSEEVKEDLRKAEKAMAEEEWEKALVYLGEVLEKEPNNKEANAKRSQASLEKGMKKFYEAGKAALERGDHNGAMENFNKIPENLSIYHKRIKDDGLLQKAIDASVVDMLDDARTLFKNRDYPGALASVDAVIKIDSNNPDAKRLRKEIISERNKLASNDARKNNPKDNGAGANKGEQGTQSKPPKATEVKIDKKERKEKMQAAIKEARSNAGRGNTAVCISKANEAKKYGAGVQADYILGLCYEKQGNGGLAAKHYNNWLRANASSKVADKVRQKIIGLGGSPVN